MKELLLAAILFAIGIVFAIISSVKYNKAKKQEGDDLKIKPHAIRFAIVFALLIASQILIIMSKH